MQTHVKLSQVVPKAIEVSIKPQTSIDYSLKLFEVSGDSLPETLRDRLWRKRSYRQQPTAQ